jgi:GNAT superfamily N-acetyltransferase
MAEKPDDAIPPHLVLAVEDRPTAADIDILPNGLERFNESAWPRHQPWQPLAVFLRSGVEVVGGLAGETYAGWLFIRYFWLDEAVRRRHLGSAVIAAAERRAIERGCHSAWVDTFSFQAPEFYRKQGYVEFGRLPYPPRGERLFLRKPLAPPPADERWASPAPAEPVDPGQDHIGAAARR